MRKRLRRRTMAPGGPLLHPHQLGLAILTAVALGAGIYVVVRYLL